MNIHRPNSVLLKRVSAIGLYSFAVFYIVLSHSDTIQSEEQMKRGNVLVVVYRRVLARVCGKCTTREQFVSAGQLLER